MGIAVSRKFITTNKYERMCDLSVRRVTHARRRSGVPSGYLWATMATERRRADTLLAERGLAASRSAAAASVRAGQVRLGGDGPSVSKPSQLLPSDADLVVEARPEFVSRGGVKLANALAELEDRGDPVAVDGRDCLDVGASTGGFTDCLLPRGAARVIALDVGYGQLAWTLREDDRVAVMERVNARSPGRQRAALRSRARDHRRLLHLPGAGARPRRRGRGR